MAETQVPRHDLPGQYEQLRPQLGRILSNFRIPPQDREDLMQTTLLLALMKSSLSCNPNSLLLGILRNRCLFYWRERRQYGRRYESLADHRPQPSIASAQGRRDLLADLATLSLRLPRMQRAVLAFHCQGMELREVAEATGLARASVESAMHRAVAHLRQAAGEPLLVPRRHRLGSPRRQRAVGPAPAAELGDPGLEPALAEALPVDQAPAAGPEPAGMPWAAAVDAFLSTRIRAATTRQYYGRHLGRARAALCCTTLGELTAGKLAAYRAAIFDSKAHAPTARNQALYALRSFLGWTGARGWHHLQPEVVAAALAVPRKPGAHPRARATAFIERARRSGHAGGEWLAAVDAFLAALVATARTRAAYRRHLVDAGAWLGCNTLGELTPEALAAYRVALLADHRASKTHALALAALRTYLLWAAAQGSHALSARTIGEVLRHDTSRPRRLGRLCSAGWAAAVEAFLASRFRAAATARNYRGHLVRAGEALADVPLARLTGRSLAAYRAALLREGRAPSSRAIAVGVLRRFLLWTAAQGLHPLKPAELRAALGLPSGDASREADSAASPPLPRQRAFRARRGNLALALTAAHALLAWAAEMAPTEASSAAAGADRGGSQRNSQAAGFRSPATQPHRSAQRRPR
jgi:RNA polymerase sigma factor (sigma-70 family)